MKKLILALTVIKNWEKEVAIMAQKGSPGHPFWIEARIVSRLGCMKSLNKIKREISTLIHVILRCYNIIQMPI